MLASFHGYHHPVGVDSAEKIRAEVDKVLRGMLAGGDIDDGLVVFPRDARFGRGGTVSLESLRSEFGQHSVRNHQKSFFFGK